MTSSPRFRRFAFAYGSAFAMLYVVVLKLDLALFTVYPTIGVVLLGTHLRDRLQGKPQSRSKRQYDDDDEFVTTGDVAALLYEVELHREKISDRLAMLRLWLHKYPELNKHFTQFEAKGGIFADEFVQFIAGRMSPRKVTKRNHLRLVVTNTRQKPKSLPRKRLNPTDAA